MKVVKIKNSWLTDSDVRLDASFHLSDGVNTKRIIEKFCPYESTTVQKASSELFKGNIHKRVYVTSPENGLMFYSASDLFKSDLNSGRYLSKKYSPHLKELELKKEWILITRSGTLGRVALTNGDHEGKIGTDDLVRIKPTNKEVKLGYLYAYLSSKYGYGLLTQSGYGGVVKHIEPHHIENLPIPILPNSIQLRVDDLIRESVISREKSNAERKLAHQIFEDNTDFVPRKKIAGMKKSHDVKQNFHLRLDSSYYLNIENPENELSKDNYNSRKLGDLVKTKMYTAQRGKRNYVPKNGIRFLSTTDISELNPLRVNKYLSWKTNGLETLRVQKNWILISSSGQDILGSAFFVDRTFENCAVNQHSIRVIIDEDIISPYYVFGYLSTSKIKEYIRSGIYGSAVLTIDENFLKYLKIPILNEDLQSKVINHIKESVDQFENACFKEKEAIELVENEIESWQKS